MLSSIISKWKTVLPAGVDAIFGSGRRDLVGLDFDDSSILALKLQPSVNSKLVEYVGWVGLPREAMKEGVVESDAMLSAAIRKMLPSTICKNIAFAVPGNKIAMKQIAINAPLSDAEAELRVFQEARKAFPDLISNLFLDFTQIQKSDDQGVLKNYLVIVATRKEDISPRIEAVNRSGFVSQVADVDYFALERAYQLFSTQLPAGHEEKYVALVDFNPRSFLFVVMHKGVAIYYTRQLYVNEVLIPMVQRALGVEAVQNKQTTYGPQTTSDIYLSEDQKSPVVMMLRRMLQTFHSENTGKLIYCMAITGRCTLLPDLMQYIVDNIGMPAVIPNPFASLSFQKSNENQSAQKMGSAFALCCGLAMRETP